MEVEQVGAMNDETRRALWLAFWLIVLIAFTVVVMRLYERGWL